MTTLRLGLIGCGVVGGALLELLDARRSDLAERFGLAFEVTRLCVRDLDRDRGPHAMGIPRTGDAMELVEAEDVDVLVEVAGGFGVEQALVAALARGRPVVSANKALIAARLGDLLGAAREGRAPFACEAAAAGAIPVLRTLGRRVERAESLLGIVNGTCNWLLTRMEQDEEPLEVCLPRAQQLGLAEADPSADIDGHDAAAKLTILAYRAFGARPTTFAVEGIRHLSPVECDLAGALGFRIRHLAQAVATPQGLHLEVGPVCLPTWHLLAGVEEEYNAVYLAFENAGDLALFGKGAGGPPTATAVLGDLVDVALNRQVGWPSPLPVEAAGAPARRWLLHVTHERHPDLPGRLEVQVRKAGLVVQSRATVLGEDRHLGLLVSETADVAPLKARLQGFSRVRRVVAVPVLQ